jgi:UDP-glucose 4-epimerase
LQSVLVTGGAGFIGHHLVNRLLSDCKVVIIDNLSSGKKSNVPDNVTFYNEDIRNKETISDIIKRERVECCIHLAAKVSVRSDDSEVKSNNVQGTLSVLEACAENKVQDFVFASSAAIYGEAKSLPVSEEHPLNPISPYGFSKMEGEKMIFSFKEANKIQHVVCLRFFNIYGEGQNPVYAGVITKFAERIAQKLPPIIYGDGEQTRDFVSVNDIASAIIIAARSNVSGTFNVATGRGISIKKLADKMLKIAGLNIGPVYQQRNMDSEIRQSVADASRAMKFLKFVAKDKLDDYLPKLIPDSNSPVER